MKRILTIIVVGLAAAGLFAALVHLALVAAHVSEPAATTVHGPTTRRLWATAAVLLALAGVVIGGLSLARAANRIGTVSSRRRAIAALAAGAIASINGGVNLAVANGGPGSGNGVIGGAAALVLGLVATTLGGLALTRSGRTTSEPECTT